MRYQEFLPAPELRPYIHLYSTLEFPEILPAPVLEKVPPSPAKGFVFCYQRDHPVHIENGTFSGELPCSFLVGQGIKSNIWQHRGGFGMFIVLFKPGRMRCFYRFPWKELSDSFLAVEDAEDEDLKRLAQQMIIVDTVNERIRLANSFFGARLPFCKDEIDLAQAAINLIHAQPQIGIERLGQFLYVTPRHLRRTFADRIGASLKAYQQLIRVCGGIDQLQKGQFFKISDVAYNLGFYDQSHFNGVFKEYTGHTPKGFLRVRPAISSVVCWRGVVEDGKVF